MRGNFFLFFLFFRAHLAGVTINIYKMRYHDMFKIPKKAVLDKKRKNVVDFAGKIMYNATVKE